MRQKNPKLIFLAQETEWQSFGSWVKQPGQSRWLGRVWLTESKIYPVNLLVNWEQGEGEPWYLVTNLLDRWLALQTYVRRMWIDEMFRNMKRHNFDLVSTMLHHPERLSCLTLALVLLYVRLVSTHALTIHRGRRHLVNRKDRRDSSIF